MSSRLLIVLTENLCVRPWLFSFRLDLALCVVDLLRKLILPLVETQLRVIHEQIVDIFYRIAALN